MEEVKDAKNEKTSSKGKKTTSKKTVVYDKSTTDPGLSKLNVLNNTIAGIEKQYGKGSIMKLGESAKSLNIPVINTGCLSLDLALGVGGLPRGRIIEIYGPESSGKSTVAMHAVAEAQKAGGIASYIDAEHAMDPLYAKKLGVNIDELYISQPDDGEQALEITEAMVRSGVIDIIVIDSVAALVPRAEIEGDMGASHMGAHARLMSQALRKLTAFISKSSCVVIFINQLREKMTTYGNPEVTTGGRALKFYASLRIDIRKTSNGVIQQGNEYIGNRVTAKVVKNKVAPPFRTCEFDIMYGEGISKHGDLLDVASRLDIVHKGGAWFSYGDIRLGQGRENSKNYMIEHPDVYAEIETAVRSHFGLPPAGSPPQAETEPEPAPAPKAAKSKAKSKKAAEETEIELDELGDDPKMVEMDDFELNDSMDYLDIEDEES